MTKPNFPEPIIFNPTPEQSREIAYSRLMDAQDRMLQDSVEVTKKMIGPKPQEPAYPAYNERPLGEDDAPLIITGRGFSTGAEPGIEYAERRRFPWLMIAAFAIIVPALVFLALSFQGGDSYDSEGRPTIATLRKAVNVHGGIKQMTDHYNIERHTVAKESQSVYDKGFADLMTRRPRIITCSYQIKGKPGTYTHQFFYGTQVPPGYEALTRLVPNGHPLRALGAGVIKTCPKTWGEGRDTLETFWNRLPPAPPLR